MPWTQAERGMAAETDLRRAENVAMELARGSVCVLGEGVAMVPWWELQRTLAKPEPNEWEPWPDLRGVSNTNRRGGEAESAKGHYGALPSPSQDQLDGKLYSPQTLATECQQGMQHLVDKDGIPEPERGGIGKPYSSLWPLGTHRSSSSSSTSSLLTVFMQGKGRLSQRLGIFNKKDVKYFSNRPFKLLDQTDC